MKKLGILTSGGDCTSMNKAITTFVQFCEHNNIEAHLIYNGFKGLVEGQIKKTTWEEVRTWYDLPGTKIYSARFPEFAEEKFQKLAANQVRTHQLDGVIVCGGNGSYIGAKKLSDQGIKVIAIPGTIDNDVASSEITIGFHSALEHIVSIIRMVRSTMESHHFISIIEIMGRECSDLTIFAGIATHADYVITGENIKTPDQIGEIVLKLRKDKPNQSIIILVTEKIYGTNNLPNLETTCKMAEKICKEPIRTNVIGYSQRAANPSAWDLVNTTRMTAAAVNMMKSGKSKLAIGNKGNEIVAIDLNDAINLVGPKRKKFIDKFINLKNY